MLAIRNAVFCGLLLIGGTANAAMVWVQNLTIESYRMYWSGYETIFEVKVREPIATGCASGDQGRLFSYWNTNSNVFHQIMQGQVVSADAQGRKVDIMYDNTVCSTFAGRMMYGVQVRPAP